MRPSECLRTPFFPSASPLRFGASCLACSPSSLQSEVCTALSRHKLGWEQLSLSRRRRAEAGCPRTPFSRRQRSAVRTGAALTPPSCAARGPGGDRAAGASEGLCRCSQAAETCQGVWLAATSVSSAGRPSVSSVRCCPLPLVRCRPLFTPPGVSPPRFQARPGLRARPAARFLLLSSHSGGTSGSARQTRRFTCVSC